MAESYFLRLKNTLWEVIKPVEGMTGWGDGAETMGWGADETPSQSNIDEPQQPSQVGCSPFQIFFSLIRYQTLKTVLTNT